MNKEEKYRNELFELLKLTIPSQDEKELSFLKELIISKDIDNEAMLKKLEDLWIE